MATDEGEVAAVPELLGVRRFVANQLEARNAAAFLVDSDDRFRLTEIAKIVDELAELLGGLDVASEENESARLNFAEEASGFGIGARIGPPIPGSRATTWRRMRMLCSSSPRRPRALPSSA